MTQPLEVDCFEIDIEDLDDATKGSMRADFAGKYVAEQVIRNLTQESKKRFEKYQDNNDACKEGE